MLHSHDFRHAAEFSGQRILVVGVGYSGEDIALQAIKFGAKEVVCSYRSKPAHFKWPDGIKEKPLVDSVRNGTVSFVDGSSEEVSHRSQAAQSARKPSETP